MYVSGFRILKEYKYEALIASYTFQILKKKKMFKNTCSSCNRLVS